MTSRHLNFPEINSRLILWHYQCPEGGKHIGGRNLGMDIQILHCLCCVLAQCYKDSFYHEMANNGSLQGESDVSPILVVYA